MLTLSGALRALADEHGVAVLVRLLTCACFEHHHALTCALQMTNHTVSGRDGDTGSLKPALGETWKSQRALRRLCWPLLRLTIPPPSAAHTRLQLTMPPASTVRVDVATVCFAEVTLGRGRGRRAQYVVAAEGLIAPAQLMHRGGGR
jgi:hypothetical protein